MVIPAHNASATIEECLQALARQSLPRSEYEVIVVDDDSSDSTRATAARYEVEVLTQAHQGPAAARNLGADEAQGEIVLFTDADCVPAHNWIEVMLSAFSDPQISGVKGAYRTRQRELIARFVQLEYEDKYDKMKKSRYIDFVDTYSAAYRKSVLRGSRGFDSAFPRASGEDVELSYRLAKRGHRMVFVPEAVVYHRHADSIWKYLKRKFHVGYWRVLMYRLHPDKVFADSHTPQILKVQVGLIVLCMLLLPSAFKWPRLWVGPLAGILAFIATTLPFSIKAFGKDRGVGLLSPLLLFLRAGALAAGLAAGILGRAMHRGA